jgi:hypothetical protein
MKNQEINHPSETKENEPVASPGTLDMAAVKRWMAGQVRINISRGWLLATGVLILLLALIALD